MSHMFSLMKHTLKQSSRVGLNKNSFPGPDRIKPALVQNEGENFTKSLSYILQKCYHLGYFPK